MKTSWDIKIRTFSVCFGRVHVLIFFSDLQFGKLCPIVLSRWFTSVFANSWLNQFYTASSKENWAEGLLLLM